MPRLGITLAFALALLDSACESRVSLGARCSSQSDCGEAEVCSLSRCRAPCSVDLGCAPELQCLRIDGGGVCALATDVCTREEDCPVPLACGIDGVCRAMCTDSSDCSTGSRCASLSGRDLCIPEAADAGMTIDDAPVALDAAACNSDEACGPRGLARCEMGACTVRAPEADAVTQVVGASETITGAIAATAYRVANGPYLAVASIEGPSLRPTLRSLELHARAADRGVMRYAGVEGTPDGAPALSMSVVTLEAGDASDVLVAALTESRSGPVVLLGRMLGMIGGSWDFERPEPDASAPLFAAVDDAGGAPYPVVAWARTDLASGLRTWASASPLDGVVSVAGRTLTPVLAASTRGPHALVGDSETLGILRVAPTVMSRASAARVDGPGVSGMAYAGGGRYVIAHIAYAGTPELVVREARCDSATCALDLDGPAQTRIVTGAAAQHLSVVQWPGGTVLVWATSMDGAQFVFAQWLSEDLRPMLAAPLRIHAVPPGATIESMAADSLEFVRGTTVVPQTPETSRVYLAVVVHVVEAGVHRIDLATLWLPIDP